MTAFPGSGPNSSQTPISLAPGGFIPTTRDGLRHLEHVMGVPVMFDICGDPLRGKAALEAAVDWLHWADATFSTYRSDSEISRLNRGELAIADLHPDVAAVLARCAELKEETDGYFDIEAPYHSGPGSGVPEAGRGGPGSVEPSGVVKGWAVARVVRILREGGVANFLVNASGDVYAAGHPDGGSAWRVGIQHPRLAAEVVLTLALRDASVATSGMQARGEHIADPFDARVPSGLLAVTITGEDIATADAYATAAFAMGAQRAAAWCAGLKGYEAALFCEDDTVLTTPGLTRLRV
jgi:thiamine biosynthesis lipoprotein